MTRPGVLGLRAFRALISYNLPMFDFDEKRPSQIPIVVLDTETTGLFPGIGHRVVEIGAVRLENWRSVAEFDRLINPERKMDAKASAVNGITDADLVGKPTFAEVAPELSALLDGALIVAHNAAFDAGFLGMEYFIANQSELTGSRKPTLPNPWLCTLLLARRHFYFGRNNLGHIARKLGVRMGKAHRALNDVYMTAEILKRMARELEKRKLATVGDLLYAQGEPVYTPTPPDVFLPEPVVEAMSDAETSANGRRLRILYLSESGETEREITPLYPSQHRGVGYLIADCHLRHDRRTFQLDRILSAELVE
ncbi:MAG: WYL domain-containing protein [Chloroflexi bacterium]|nr:WYL domain-containing protein [Chloroflexota bacterium]